MKLTAYKSIDDPEVEELVKNLGLDAEEQAQVFESLRFAGEIIEVIFKMFGERAQKENEGVVLRGALLTVIQTLFTRSCEMVRHVEGQEHIREHIINLMINPIREQGYILSLHGIKSGDDNES